MSGADDPLRAARRRVIGVDTPVLLRDGQRRRYVNLDNAASTPALREVLDAVLDFLPWYSSVHRGAGAKSRLATRMFEQARETVLRFVGADPGEHVAIFGKNATEAINKLSCRLALDPHDVVLVSSLDHHSNDLPWRGLCRLERIGADANGKLDEQHCLDLLHRHRGRVRLLAVTGGSNVTGVLPPIHRLAAAAHEAGARILVDAAQLAPHRPIDMRRLSDSGHLDYVAFSGHKLYAPFGSGVLVGRRDTFARGAPEQKGGGTVRFVSAEQVVWADAPDREEAGTPNVVGAVALAAALSALNRIGFDAIARHEARLTERVLRGLGAVDGVRLYGDPDPTRASSRLGVIPFNVAERPHALVAAILASEHGIGVRNGCFCAHPYVARLLGLSVADMRTVQDHLAADDRGGVPGLVRVSLGVYNDEQDVDRLVQAVRRIALGQHRHDYRLDRRSGEYRGDADTDPVLRIGACLSAV